MLRKPNFLIRLFQKLEEEYHHLSLWYFVGFFYGIISCFKSIDDLSYINSSCKVSVFFSLSALSFFLLCLIIFLKKKEEVILSVLVTILLFFVLGMSCAWFRINNISTIPLAKIGIFDIEAKLLKIKPTTGGVQLILTDITVLGVKNDDAENYNFNKIKVSVRGKSGLDFSKNDIITLRAKLFPLGGALLPGGYDFGLYMYLKGIQATGFSLNTPKLISSDSNYFDGYVQNIRTIIYKKLIENLGKNKGNFVAAILLGETKGLDNQLAENMRNSGIAHILSVSGLHLSLVAAIFFMSSRFLLNCSDYLSYKINIKILSGVISILGSFCYLLLSGSNIAATRAFIMTFFIILALIFERSPYPLRSVMIAGGTILLFLPEYVMHPSFQLSFSAVLCLISGYEIYLRNRKILGKTKGIFSSIKLYVLGNIYSSFLGSIVTAPFVIYHFYKFATYSILMNLLAVPLMSFFMMPLAILSLILMPFGASYFSLKFLGFFVQIIIDSTSVVANLPSSIINTGYITDFSILVFSFGFFWICLWQTSWRYWGVGIILISLTMMYLSPKPDFIYDHRIKAISIKEGDIIDIYSKHKLSNFTKKYWMSWYGVEKSRSNIIKDGIKDKLFLVNIDDSKDISIFMNYKKCFGADIEIITSSKLSCSEKGGDKLTVPYEDLINYGVVLIFCQKDNCYVKLGQKSFWKAKKNDY